MLLVGVGLDRLTILHLAEVEAGRRPFIYWMRGPDGEPMRSRCCACSDGFANLEPVLASLETTTSVGESTWRIFPVRELVATAAEAIRASPSITRCDDPACIECPDAVAGGPIKRPATRRSLFGCSFERPDSRGAICATAGGANPSISCDACQLS